MIFRDLAFIPIVLIIISTSFIIIRFAWRKMMIALAVQYLAAFWLVALSWPLGLAFVKLLIGIVVCVVLGSSSAPAEEDLIKEQTQRNSARFFRGFLALLGVVLAFSLAPGLHVWLPASDEALHGGLLLIVAGLLQLGITTRPGNSVVGLLTVLSGFEVLYASLESSVLVAGLLAVINMGLAVVAVYSMTSTAGEGNE